MEKKNGNTKFTDTKVRAIFKDRKNGMLQKDIAKKHGISQSHVSTILNGKSRLFA